jgi:hypothetical protein
MQKSNNIKVLGVSGYARSGKNTFVEIAKNILTKNNYRVIELAFATKLKNEVQEMLRKSKFGLDILSLSADEKERVRPIFVFWGCQRRSESEGGLYWVNEVDQQIQSIVRDAQTAGESTDRMVILVSDVRFPNEAKWVHEKWSGQIIHLKKWQSEWRKAGQDGGDEVLVKVYDPPPNEEEAKQDPLVEAAADVRTEWEGKGKATAAIASAELDLHKVVIDALNKTKFFKHPEPIIGTLSL